MSARQGDGRAEQTEERVQVEAQRIERELPVALGSRGEARLVLQRERFEPAAQVEMRRLRARVGELERHAAGNGPLERAVAESNGEEDEPAATGSQAGEC